MQTEIDQMLTDVSAKYGVKISLEDVDGVRTIKGAVGDRVAIKVTVNTVFLG